MRILQINKFFYLKGGSERYMFNLSKLLEEKRHSIAFFSMDHPNNVKSSWSKYFIKNVNYNKSLSLKEKINLFKNTLYSREAEKNLSKLIDYFKPDITHVHNFNHQLTPSVLVALKKKGIPIIATLHDYKLVCPSYLMLNHGSVCELCKGGRFYNCLRTRCHKNSLSKSMLATLESYLHHNILNSYRHIDRYICPSLFLMNKLQYMGFKGDLISIPNFVDLKNLEFANSSEKNKIVCWGRLSHEKGISTLIKAVSKMNIELDIIGDGPIKSTVERKIKTQNIKNINIIGCLSGDELFNRIRKSSVAVITSQYYENNPIAILEAFALGMPVIASRIGGIPELVKDDETGLLFQPGDVDDLRNKINKLLGDQDKIKKMGRNAKALIEKKYNPQTHYIELMRVYDSVIKENK